MSRRARFYLVAAAVVPAACLAVFYLDKDVHAVTDLFKPGVLSALIYYVPPTYLVCAVIFHFAERRRQANSMALALGSGIPAGILFVIIALNILMGRCSH